MVCIYCSNKTSVTNSRSQSKLNQTWRRRQCKRCGAIFTSVEQVNLPTSLLYKNKSGQLQPFERDILFISIYEACKHRKTATSDATAVTSTILSKLLPKISQASLKRGEIIKTSLEALNRFDKAAGTYYAAYHF